MLRPSCWEENAHIHLDSEGNSVEHANKTIYVPSPRLATEFRVFRAFMQVLAWMSRQLGPIGNMAIIFLLKAISISNMTF